MLKNNHRRRKVDGQSMINVSVCSRCDAVTSLQNVFDAYAGCIAKYCFASVWRQHTLCFLFVSSLLFAEAQSVSQSHLYNVDANGISNIIYLITWLKFNAEKCAKWLTRFISARAKQMTKGKRERGNVMKCIISRVTCALIPFDTVI